MQISASVVPIYVKELVKQETKIPYLQFISNFFFYVLSVNHLCQEVICQSVLVLLKQVIIPAHF